MQTEFAPATTATELPPQVAAFDALFRRFKEAAAEFDQKMRNVVAEECRVRGLDQDYLSLFGRCALEDRKMEDVVNGIREAVVRFAEGYFSPRAARLSIDRHALEYAPDWRQFEATKLWEELVSRYAASAADLAYCRLAKDTSAAFSELYGFRGGNASGAVKTVGGRPVLTTSIFGCHIMGHTYDYADIERLRKAFECLAAVMVWGGLGECPEGAVGEACNRFKNLRAGVAERFDFGGQVQVVPFKSKVEFRVSPALADQIRLLLAEYPPVNR